MASNYLPPYAQCTLSNALFWGNCYNHYNNLYNNPGWNCVTVFHLSALFLESFPVIGQTISVFEFFISLLYYYFYPPQIAQNPLMQPVPIPLPYRTWPMPLEAPPAPQDPMLQRIGGMISDRHLVCFPRKGTKKPTRIITALWSHHIFHYLDQNDLTQLRYVSHFFNNILALAPSTGRVKFQDVGLSTQEYVRIIVYSCPWQLLSFSRQELFAISPKLFQLEGWNEQGAIVYRESRIHKVQRALRKSQITLSPEELLTTKEELSLRSSDTPHRFEIFHRLYMYQEYIISLQVTKNSTSRTLFTQFVIRCVENDVTMHQTIEDIFPIRCMSPDSTWAQHFFEIKFSAIDNVYVLPRIRKAQGASEPCIVS